MRAPANPVIQREVNFGGNLTWQTRCYRPASEAEVLDILARHVTSRIRVLGRAVGKRTQDQGDRPSSRAVRMSFINQGAV
jgi:hypothetical protein